MSPAAAPGQPNKRLSIHRMTGINDDLGGGRRLIVRSGGHNEKEWWLLDVIHFSRFIRSQQAVRIHLLSSVLVMLCVKCDSFMHRKCTSHTLRTFKNVRVD